MLAPALLIIALVTIFPIGYSVWMSLNNISSTYSGFQFSFAGFSNYVTVFHAPIFWQSLLFTVMYAAVTVVVEMVLGLLVALALNQPIRGRGVAIAVMLVPWTLITVISAQMWGYIYNGIYGVLNAVLMSLHIINSQVLWLGAPTSATISIMIADIWKTTPFVTMILLAGLQLIPSDLYESAKIDGATGWRSFWHVTFPLLRPSLGLAALFRILQAFGLFDLPFVLTNGGPGTSTEPIAMLAYKAIFNDGNFGTGTAVAVSTVGIVILLALLSLKALRTQVGEID
ncbi:sugar ABC transporter permease [Ferroacidibacillus organovorans]|uniref:Sugar ABC transporter permease n=2 Tax=Ferroacidibacillus organovorans TaxID=1765683 RepID=A0A101XSC0_9BACL|nr:sugar ABC transporter permease [Ferroacidibacillus organovorans]